ncbi:MAG: hypothetical protein IT380_01235 [Myxococcales bacterium]|nr:hypothetical protein [Myxococcales bacterium]
MRWFAALLALAVLGCSTGPLESGRYACNPSSDDPAQCPGDWRCGLEQYCHARGDTSVAWRCETAADCEGGWACGLARARDHRECHDPAVPEDWPCETGADCAGAWACGIAQTRDYRQCHDPATPKAWPCEGPDDCVGGWSCGLAPTRDHRQCHDPALPQEWPCEVVADCVAGWQCGLSFDRVNRECHNPQAPRDWACAGDADCLGGWRCGTDGLCVDPAADALRTDPLADLLDPTKLSPLSSSAAIERFSVSPLYEAGLGRGVQTFAFMQSGELSALRLDYLGASLTRYSLGRLSGVTSFVAMGSRGAHLGGFDEELFDDRTRLLVSFTDAGTTGFTLAPDGGVTVEHGVLDFQIDHFKLGSGASGVVPSVVAFSSAPSGAFARLRGIDVGTVHSYWADPPTLDFDQFPGNVVVDMAAVKPAEDLECVFAVDRRGLWVTQRSLRTGVGSYVFEPVHLPPFDNAACGPANQVIAGVESLGANWLLVRTRAGTGGDEQVSVLDLSPLWIEDGDGYYCTSFSGLPCTAGDRIPVQLQYGPCAACPGGVMEDMALVRGVGADPAVEVRCGQADGGPGALYRLSRRSASSFTCDRALLQGESSLFTSRNLVSPEQETPGGVSWGGWEGQLWSGEDATHAVSIALDRPAIGVVRRGADAGDVLAFTEEVVARPAAGVGLFSTRESSLRASVAHRPAWALMRNLLVDLSGAASVNEARTLGFVGTSQTVLAGPFHVVTTTASSGAQVAVVGAGTVLFAGELDRVLSGQDPFAALTQRAASVNPILSLAFPGSSPPASAWLSGYAVSGGRVQRVVAESPTRWRFEELTFPAALVPREVWFDGERGRVGFDDGVVYSLPSRVPIAPPLPGAQAVDFAQTCGLQLALAPSGLFRFEPEATGPIGRWAPVPLPPGFGAQGLADGRLHAVADEVYVFTRTGETARLTLAPCPP